MENKSGRQDKKKSALENRIIQAIREMVEQVVREELGKLPKSFLDDIRVK